MVSSCSRSFSCPARCWFSAGSISSPSVGFAGKWFPSFLRFSNSAAAPVGRARRAGHQVATYVEALSEIEQLRRENQRLRGWEWRARELERKLVQVSALARTAEEIGLEFVTARVVADSKGPFANSILVNVGHKDGVRVGFAAVSGDGLVGHVVDVGDRAARVLLLNDTSSRIPVSAGPSMVRAILKGEGGDAPRLAHYALPDKARRFKASLRNHRWRWGCASATTFSRQATMACCHGGSRWASCKATTTAHVSCWPPSLKVWISSACFILSPPSLAGGTEVRPRSQAARRPASWSRHRAIAGLSLQGGRRNDEISGQLCRAPDNLRLRLALGPIRCVRAGGEY